MSVWGFEGSYCVEDGQQDLACQLVNKTRKPTIRLIAHIVSYISDNTLVTVSANHPLPKLMHLLLFSLADHGFSEVSLDRVAV